MGKLEDLEKLQKLKESGVITEEEFNLEKTKILNGNDNANINNNASDSKDMLEIKGDFPFAESKIPLKLLEGEKVILQHETITLTGLATTAVNGLLTLTNKRILFNKKTTAKSFLGTGFLGMALAAGNKDVVIKFAQIQSIEAKKIRTGAGIEVITNDGYTYKFIPQPSKSFSKDNIDVRDMIVELVQRVIKSK